jgi:microcystin-dependent protein
MSEQFLGEIRLFGGTFAPVGWVFCDGALLQISQYDALFQLIGTTYGGDGIEKFAVPDLRGRVPLHASGTYVPGETGGAEIVTLTTSSLPPHTHTALAAASPTSTSPAGAGWSAQATAAYTAGPGTAPLSPVAIGAAGGAQPHENMPPFLVTTHIIAVDGVYPTPN